MKSTDKEFQTALAGRTAIPSIVSIPATKRDAYEDTEELENALRPDKKGAKKNKKQKRHD